MAIRDASVQEQVRAENAQAPGTILGWPLGGATLPHSGGSQTVSRGVIEESHAFTHSLSKY